MSKEMQESLLEVLEERTVVPVGGNDKTDKIKVDVCVIAATNSDLEALVGADKFRKDLFFRLKRFVIKLPPLKQRPGDIPKLAKHFLQEFQTERKSGVYR